MKKLMRACVRLLPKRLPYENQSCYSNEFSFYFHAIVLPLFFKHLFWLTIVRVCMFVWLCVRACDVQLSARSYFLLGTILVNFDCPVCLS